MVCPTSPERRGQMNRLCHAAHRRRKGVGCCWALLVCCSVAASVSCCSEKPQSTTWHGEHLRSFIWLSDLHMDALYGRAGAYGSSACSSRQAIAYGQFGCDSPPALVTSALKAAANAEADSDFVVFSGDFVRHNTSGLPQVIGTHEMVASMISSLLRKTASGYSVPVLGNNDLWPGNHLEITTDVPYDPSSTEQHPNRYLSSLAELWRRYQLLATATEQASFSHGGYYARQLPSGLWLLVLNTVMYSQEINPPPQFEDPLGQLTWLQSQLSRIEGSGGRAYIIGHNPPTLQSYRPGQQSWSLQFLNAYTTICHTYKATIAAHLYGHTHSGEIRAIQAGGREGAPVLSQNSVVPTGKNGLDHSNPAFSILRYDASTKRIVDIEVLCAKLGEYASAMDWHQMIPSVGHLLQIPSMDTMGVVQLADNMLHDDAAYQLYRNVWYKAGVQQPSCEGSCRREQLCLIKHATDMGAYARCVAQQAVVA